jgi:hypothetical protein
MKTKIIGIFVCMLLMTTVGFASADWWPMFGHDLGSSRSSSSPAPVTNNPLFAWTTGGWVDSCG